MQRNGRNDPYPFGDLLAAAEQAYDAGLPSTWDRPARAAIANGDGEIVAAGAPTMSSSLAATLRDVREFFGTDWSAGDIALTNDVFSGCSHPTEFTAVCPVFSPPGGEKIQGWFVLRANLGDVGGWELGGYTLRALDIWAEGVRIVPVKLSSKGRVRREVVDILRLNSRTPHLNAACAAAFVAAANAALRHGDVSRIDKSGADLLATARQRAAERLRTLPTGRKVATATVAAHNSFDITIKVALEMKGDSLRVSFPDAPSRCEKPVNATLYMVQDAVNLAVSSHLGFDRVETIGLASITVVDAPEDSLLSATHTAPVSHALLTTCLAVEQAVRHALVELGVSAERGAAEALPIRSQSHLIDPLTGGLSAARQRDVLAINRQLGGPR